ncbi:MAG: hypothetical protein GWN11_05275, partial [Candidatus Dadabacteria bacterium]|nr:hypothetical protein [Candidatus Dadabacteria bacterium]
MYNYTKIKSSLGDVYAVTSSGVLSNLILGLENFKEFRVNNKSAEFTRSDEPSAVLNELKSYFDGDLKKFSYKLDISKGTKF